MNKPRKCKLGRPRMFETEVRKAGEANPCDCPYSKCPGCWYACPSCGSNKCSPFCRVERKQPLQWIKSD